MRYVRNRKPDSFLVFINFYFSHKYPRNFYFNNIQQTIVCYENQCGRIGAKEQKGSLGIIAWTQADDAPDKRVQAKLADTAIYWWERQKLKPPVRSSSINFS
jgi:hypothetical protein